MRSGTAKQIVYRYDGHMSSDEMELDAQGVLMFKRGNIVRRHGKNWKVKSVELESVTADLNELPSWRVYLVDGQEATRIPTAPVPHA